MCVVNWGEWGAGKLSDTGAQERRRAPGVPPPLPRPPAAPHLQTLHRAPGCPGSSAPRLRDAKGPPQPPRLSPISSIQKTTRTHPKACTSAGSRGKWASLLFVRAGAAPTVDSDGGPEGKGRTSPGAQRVKGDYRAQVSSQGTLWSQTSDQLAAFKDEQGHLVGSMAGEGLCVPPPQ